MKKKGLIVATIVMVLVLAASITTATYAWFSVEASATINAISIETRASDGLQIASYDPTNSTLLNLYSGDVAPMMVSSAVTTGDLYWGADAPGSFGSMLTLQASLGSTGENTTQISNMYGASGNGVSMFYNADSGQKLDASGKPETLARAIANVNYFVLDFILQSTAADSGTVFIKELSVEPTIKSNMAGSARIALFAKAGTETPTGTADWDISTDGKFLYDPYGYQRLNNGVWQASNDISLIKFATQEGLYNSAMTGIDLSSLDNWGNKYIVSSAPTTGVGTPTEITQSFATVAQATNVNANFSLGLLNSANYMTLRLVIWFDGEDSACTQLSAGGGINVNINFGLEVATATA